MQKLQFKNISKYLLLIVTVFIALLFGLAESSFFKVDNLLDIIRSASILGIIGVGLTMVLASGEIDLAVGAESSAGGIFVALLVGMSPIKNYWLCILITLVLMLGYGLINSFLILKVKVPAFVCTLGMSTLSTGFAKYLTGGGTYFSMGWPKEFTFFGQGFISIVPVSVILFIIVAIFGGLFLGKTRTGRYIYAVGANPIASSHVGINTQKQKAIALIICALLAGFSGIIQASMLNSVTPEMGNGYTMTAMSTCMLGATFYKPGVYNIPGTVVGSLLLATITNGLTMVGASFYMKDIVQGAILLLAVASISLIKKGGLPSMKL